MSFLTSQTAVILIPLLFAIGAFGAILLQFLRADERSIGYWAHTYALLASVLGFLTGGAVLLSGQALTLSSDSLMPLLTFSIRIDALSGFFMMLISLVAGITSIYGFGYQEKFIGEYRLGTLGFFYNIFIGSMLFVVLANNALFFLFLWEIMSIASYFLVIYEYREVERTKAGFLYLVMAHAGAAFIMLACFLAYAATGSLDFDVWRSSLANASETVRFAVLTAAIIGFGTKAGIVPLHIWLPEAHPAAPSHVSALMSGVMIKTAVFMLIRFFFDFLPGQSLYWGLAVLLLGAVSSLLGVLYALAEHDIKRFLAYSTVENSGIIFMGVGSAIVFWSSGAPQIAAVALAAALFHTMNHAIFKSLLFLGAGSVVHATGTRHMEHYGGLIKALPYTSFFFLIGSLAISAFPPFNGFASEWLTFQALIVGIHLKSLPIQMAFITAVASLALTGGLAAASFVKAFGVTFLARSRARTHTHIEESSWHMIFAMGVLATLIFMCGMCASVITPVLIAIGSYGNTSDMALTYQMIPMSTVTAAILVTTIFATAVIAFVTRNRRIVLSETWDCGTPLTPRTEITAMSFSRSLVIIFNHILRATKQKSVQYHDAASHYFISSHGIEIEHEDVYRSHLVKPLYTAVDYAARQARRIQNGNVNTYIFYTFATVIILLLFIAYT